jgi:hypothetical protein
MAIERLTPLRFLGTISTAPISAHRIEWSRLMPLVDHPSGNYRFLPGIAPYSCGVVSSPGFEIVHVTWQNPLPYRSGFRRIAEFLERQQRPKTALCAVELRSPLPFTFAGFAEFNSAYAEILRDWGIFVDGVNPVARTNVAPELDPPSEPSLYGFSFTQPSVDPVAPTFIVAGAGELPEGILARESIVSRGDLSSSGMAAKAHFVVELMVQRLAGLGVEMSRPTTINIYTVHDFSSLLVEPLLAKLASGRRQGVHWHYTRPPIVDIEFEMDLRGVRSELLL